MNRWYLIYTKPRQEVIALNNLKNQNFETYLPLANREKILKGKKFLISEPMFPRYLFVTLNNDRIQSLSPIRSTKGVHHLVSFAGSPATLDNEAIKKLKTTLDENLIEKAFSKGDNIEIFDGPFKGLEAFFRSYSEQDKAILLLNFMAKHVEAHFDLTQFKKVA